MFKISNPNPGPRAFYVVELNKEKSEVVSRTKHTVPAHGHIIADISADEAKKHEGSYGLTFEPIGKAKNQADPGAEVVRQVTGAEADLTAPTPEVRKVGRQYAVFINDEQKSELKNKAGAEADLTALLAN